MRLGHEPNGGWATIIGIVTAICGNVLISVALNTQRYAHIRLHEQWVAKQRRRQTLLKQASHRAYGATQNGRAAVLQNGGKSAKGSKRAAAADNGTDESESAPLLSSPVSHTSRENPDAALEEVSQEIPKKTYLKSPLWWAGQIMMTVGEAGNFLAYGFAPASIVSPLGVVALVSNCIIAPFFLKERFRMQDFCGVVTAIAGAITVALSATDNNPKLGPDDIWKLIATWEFETYLGITVFAIVCLMFASNKYGKNSIFIDLGLVGLFGGYTALSTKGVASMLSYTMFKALTFPVTYLLVAILILTAVMQIKYLNRALSRFDATQVIPTQFVLFTLSVIIGSAILYRDFERTSSDDAGKFVAGCALTFVGVWLITSSRTRERDEEERFEIDEDAIHLGVEAYQGMAETMSLRHPSTQAAVDTSDEGLPNGTMIIRRRTNDSIDSFPTLSQTGRIPLHEASSPIPTPEPQLASGTPSVPSTYTEASSVSEHNWPKSGQQTPRRRFSLQKLLQPLATIFPHQSLEPLQPPANIEAMHSAPVLPSETRLQPSRPETPHNVSEHDNNHLATPITPHAADGSHLLSRNSFSALVPGPLSAPLSTPLSAIVADSLRRGVDLESPRTHKRPKPRLKLPGMPWKAGFRQRSTSETDATHVGSENDAESEDLRDLYARSPSGPPKVRGESGRVRSLSTTLSDLLKRSKKKVVGVNEAVATTSDDEEQS